METRISSPAVIAAALCIAIGFTIGGYFVGEGFREGRKTDRYVTVKGLSERFVKADVAIWMLRFTATGDDLGQAQEKIDRDLDAITSFLTDAGLKAEEIRPLRLEVTDRLAQAYRGDQSRAGRFTISQTIRVRTDSVDLVAALSRRTGELVKRGVILSDMGGPSYLYTKLNEIKPSMIAEATRNARRSAEQFAADSNSRIADIRRANQGVFQILARDGGRTISEANQLDKKVRVVSTIVYLLAD
jgi:hypothetical protein